MMTEPHLSDMEMAEIRARCHATTQGPWRARIERREGFAGSDFIETAADDIELHGATEADYDFIANARQDVPRLLAEIERLKSMIRG